MKKGYIKPVVHLHRVIISSLMAGSVPVSTSTSPANQADGQLSKESKTEWGDIWGAQ